MEVSYNNLSIAQEAIESEIKDIKEQFKDELRLKNYQNNIGVKSPTRPTPYEIKIEKLENIVETLKTLKNQL